MSAQEAPSSSSQIRQNYAPDIPHTDFEVARLRLAVSALALEFAATQGTDEVSARRLAKQIASANVSALLGHRTILSLALYDPTELRHIETIQAEVEETATPLQATEEAKPKSRVWRTRFIEQAPEKRMPISALLDFYFPEKTDEEKIAAIRKLSLDLRSDLEAAPKTTPNNLSRAMVLLVQSRSYLNDFDHKLAQQTTEDITDTMGSFIKKTRAFVYSIVSRYADAEHSFALADLIAEGQIGLLKGLERFDLNVVTKGNVLHWCFNHVRGQAIDELRKNGYFFTAGRSDAETARALDDPDAEQRLAKDELRKAREARDRFNRSRIVYLDEPVFPGADRTLMDRIAKDYAAEDEEDSYHALGNVDVEGLLSELDERNQVIVRMRFGFPPYDDRGSEGYTMKEIGEVFDVSESRISQLITKVILPKLERVIKGQENSAEKKSPKVEQPEQQDFSDEKLLTQRELEILSFASYGLENSQIAKKLFISEETVKSHVRHLLGKLGAKNRTHTVRLAFELGIFKKEDKVYEGEQLSPREMEVLELASEGFSSQVIGKKLNLSKNTVNSHIKKVLTKMNVKNRTHAVRVGFEAGFLK